MRILLVTEASSAGVGRHVIDLCGALVARNHDVHLVYATGRIDDAFAGGVHALDSRKALSTAIIEMRRGPHPSDRGALRALANHAATHGPFDIVHGQSSKGGGLARLLRGRHGTENAATVYTPHCIYTLNPEGSWLKRALFGRAELWLARRTDAIIAVSPSEARHLEELGMPPDLVHCVPNGIARPELPSKAEARGALGLPSDALIVGFLARLSPQKNPLLAIEAFARVAQKHRAVHLAFAGTGALEGACRELAASRGITDRIHWLGYGRPGTLLPASDVFALSSEYEGMPYVYLEALVAGLPIVTTDVGGAELAIEEGINGFVVPRGDPDSFAAALDRVLSDEALRRRMAMASSARADRFDDTHMVEGTVAVYEAALARKRAREASRP
ncbi:MAG: glycosyltransferase family 4 protein [Planctomycetes bacterium]|nr:glycosyltransferase family 4 protein [Planctomycetota bacterium]MCB9919980.1 glycosyltransferase family 4 protein [Planctomycetota bacterium]